MQRHFFFTPHPLSTVNFATATVLAFVLLRDSRFNFHYYTQREATPTQKSKCTVTSHEFLRERLQSAFTLANQLHRIAQYIQPFKQSLSFQNKIQNITFDPPPLISQQFKNEQKENNNQTIK